MRIKFWTCPAVLEAAERAYRANPTVRAHALESLVIMPRVMVCAPVLDIRGKLMAAERTMNRAGRLCRSC